MPRLVNSAPLYFRSGNSTTSQARMILEMFICVQLIVKAILRLRVDSSGRLTRERLTMFLSAFLCLIRRSILGLASCPYESSLGGLAYLCSL